MKRLRSGTQKANGFVRAKKTKKDRPRSVWLSDNAIARLKVYLAKKQTPLSKRVIRLNHTQLQLARTNVFQKIAEYDADTLGQD
jgi:site-specific recombinase XerD